jgi:hypothetical protein
MGPPGDLLSRRFTEDLDHGPYLSDRFGGGTQERDQTFPWILSDHSQPLIFLDGLVNDRVLVDLSINEIHVFIQPEKLNHKRLFGSLKEKEFSDLPDGKNPIRGLNQVSVEDLGKPKKLSAFQGMLKRKTGGSESGCHSLLSMRRNRRGLISLVPPLLRKNYRRNKPKNKGRTPCSTEFALDRPAFRFIRPRW